MNTKRKFAITVMLASIVMVAGSSTTAAYAQLFGTDTSPQDNFKLVLLNDLSGSIEANDPPNNPTCGVVDGVEGEWETELDGKAAGLLALFLASPALFEHVEITVVGFAESAAVKVGPTVINTQADLDDFVGVTGNSGICQIAKDLGDLTCISCAFDVATTVIQTNNFALGQDDLQIIDLITDGEPTLGENPPLNARQAALDAGFDIIVALAIGEDDVDPDALALLTFPGVSPGPIFTAASVINANPPGSNLPNAQDQGFVITVPSFDGFAEAFQAKLFAEITACGNGIVEEELGEECEPPNTLTCDSQCHFKEVGGEFLPIDSTALLIAGMSANMVFLAPIVLGIAGTAAYFIISRMNKE